MVSQSAPARVTRGLPLPDVKCNEEPPYVVASRNPNGAITIGTLGRISNEKGYYFPKADVTLKIGKITGKIGIFGYLISEIGLSAASSGDLSDPAMVLEIDEK